MVWFTEGMSFLPFFLVIWSSSTFIVCYIIAVLRRDVDVIFPYISDTGDVPPESCIFGMMTVIVAFTGTFTMYIRYKYVEKLTEMTGVVNPHLNKAAFWIGMLSCLTMCFVATFQETAVRIVHDVAAVLFFLSGVTYTVLQSVISFCAHPYGSSKTLCYTRAVISTIGVLTVIPAIICASICSIVAPKTSVHQDPEAPYYTIYLVSAVCEWIVAFTFVFFFYTYIRDFKMFTLRLQTELVEHS